ncbi:hypothetical protein [Microbacterium lacticum]
MLPFEQQHHQVISDRQLPIDLVFGQRVVELRLDADNEPRLGEDDRDIDLLFAILCSDIRESTETVLTDVCRQRLDEVRVIVADFRCERPRRERFGCEDE